MIRTSSVGWIATLWVLVTTSGCASFGPTPVGPADIPALQERAARESGNGEAQLLLGAALASAGRCEEAVEVAERGRALAPSDPAGPLIIGQCLEEAGDFSSALAVYSRFISANPDVSGLAAVEGRRVVALQLQAREAARSALEREESLEPPNPETVGVLPFIVDGDPSYGALSVGLAHMLTTDLALLGRFPLVERVELNALLEEMEIPANMVDPTTAARAGRLMGASRMILGTLSIPSEEETRLAGNIVLETGELVEPLNMGGDLGDLLSLEKEYALRVAEGLGYQLSEAERQRILDNRPGSLAAFLAFSNGLFSEERGDFEGAAAYFQDAVREDPQYEEAQVRLRSATGADAVVGVGPGEALVVGARIEQNLEAVPGASLLSNVLASSVLDIASQQPERATMDAGTATTIIDLLPEGDQLLPSLEAIIIILITIPR